MFLEFPALQVDSLPLCQNNNYINVNSLYTKIKRQIKDLNVRPYSIKVLEENISRTLFDINHSKIFFDPPSQVVEIKAKINKWGLLN